MTEYSLTAWCEGMFLRPQHFQQQDRALTAEFRDLAKYSSPYYWGVWDLHLSEAALKDGKVRIDSLTAIFPDMTVVDCPAKHKSPKSVSIDKGVENTLLKIVLPELNYQEKSVRHDSAEEITRFSLDDVDLIDTNTGLDEETIQVKALNLELKLSNERLAGYVEIPICRIKEVSPEGEVILDNDYIPPSLNVMNNSKLIECLENVTAMTKIRADSISQRLGQGKAASASAVDFIMLQMLNKYEAKFRHLKELDHFSTVNFSMFLQSYLGELATFSNKSKRIPSIEQYDHLDLGGFFSSLNQTLSRYLSVVLDQTATKLPLEPRQYGIHVAPLPDKKLLESCQFVLAIKADINTEEIRRLVPGQLKFGAVEQIRDLINNQINGISVAPLSVVPRQIAYQAGYVYFEVIKKGHFWARLNESGGLALHLSGNFPNAELELWCISQ
ncbi:type VI secretion system baseplate subunit TssK [Vibrio rotiferianus]|uniref:type VI secretion system baseplate subunit TssK n=1 Tax=Vibrio rotiferianus TaxID=190895 RepID=UPI00406A5E6E